MGKKVSIIILSLLLILSTFVFDLSKAEAFEKKDLLVHKDEVSERIIKIPKGNETIVGTLPIPQNATKPCKVLLMLHGFAGQRNELPITNSNETMFGKSARIFTEQGYATLRIDFLGCGDSSEKWENTTFTRQISDVDAVLKYLKCIPEIDSKGIALLGLSQGGLIAACVASTNPMIKSLILWSPVANPPYTYSNLLGSNAIQEGLQSQNKLITAKLPWGAETTLRSEFFKELFDIDPIAQITSYRGPLQVVVGLNDAIVTPQPQAGELYIKNHHDMKNVKDEIIKLDADHMLDITTDNREPLNEALWQGIKWLDKTL